MSDTSPYRRFFAELKRRGVFRAAALYGTVGFVVAEAADIFVPALRLPPWIVTAVALVVVIGFPAAIVLAWNYERTPTGMRRTEAAGPEELAAIAFASRARRWPAGIAALVGVALIGATAWWLATGRIRGTGPYDSIAVLPFANLSEEPGGETFSDGLSEELLNGLAGVEDLRVAARTSSFGFKGTAADVRTIADSLGVETILEGSVRRAGDRVRITVQLVDAERGFQLWSGEYDRELRDVFAVQDEIAGSVVRALIPRLRPSGDEQLVRGGTRNVEAYDQYLAGREKWRTRRLPQLGEAIEHFRRAVELDPEFALGWSGLADAIDALAYRDTTALPLVPEARQAALRSLALDPELAEGWASAAVLALEFDRDTELALIGLRRAVELRPSYATARQWLGGTLRDLGRVEDGLVQMRIASELDPLTPFMQTRYGVTLAVAGRWDEARQVLERNAAASDLPDVFEDLVNYAPEIGLDSATAGAYAERWARAVGHPDPQAWRVLATARYEADRTAEALGLLEQLDADGYTVEASLWLRFGGEEHVLQRVLRKWRSGEADFEEMSVRPEFGPLRADPRFQEVLRDLGLPNGYDPVTGVVTWP
jgi:serine/threonine-protein kinase